MTFNGQTLPVLLDTGSGDLFIASDECNVVNQNSGCYLSKTYQIKVCTSPPTLSVLANSDCLVPENGSSAQERYFRYRGRDWWCLGLFEPTGSLCRRAKGFLKLRCP